MPSCIQEWEQNIRKGASGGDLRRAASRLAASAYSRQLARHTRSARVTAWTRARVACEGSQSQGGREHILNVVANHRGAGLRKQGG
eukprot:3272418-Pyramimonas_sp.AAC.1